jgi:hypothetical protein
MPIFVSDHNLLNNLLDIHVESFDIHVESFYNVHFFAYMVRK